MRFNNNLLLASFLGVATALRRTCWTDPASDLPRTGFYSMTNLDTWSNVAADFCTSVTNLQNLNPNPPITTHNYIRVPCRYPRIRDCSRIPGTDYGYYTVVDGEEDQLTSIGQDFCSDVDELADLNPDITMYMVSSGMVLKVPCSWN
ncbi:uncharacterized protein L3040_007728 [Drepanopeziza brunnea f. sp. 'multigermtubi']|uniref:Putative Ecp7(P20) n=1 Tax=Marssonina brunnea f. sp. multigermtubi (strain MB_m1) TaxID=1072389 RepID=K1WYK8_MARBU|nr:putative Ecp7(P20) [Drepanopeziza brunnea f. sp. 'multigermtubi' MB_m1]EKD18091.1 putative Ecp7(P20) [Drepanopeziza brunnea f. sp. 'multigermtubi' MB_m1]KAJ5037556.1 hypothetical protein L3040_007728 [Drepanopeziza brunnea f. sp. 'multigermtubi']